MSSSKKKKLSAEGRARAASPNALPAFDEAGLVPVEQARKLTREQADLLRAHGRYITPERVEGKSPDSESLGASR